MSESCTVHVSGISSGTTDKEVTDFFSFCGKISSISLTPVSDEPNAAKSASVTFEKDAAAKTALLLDNTQLGGSAVQVESAQSLDDMAKSAPSAETTKEGEEHHIDQEDKPRSRIVAEYLAHGYVISDAAVQKAIALDQKHGFSARFTSALANFDKKVQATDRARGLDESYKLSDKAASGWRGINSYFEKAMGTPSGRKVMDFYARTDKQARDIHNEARRLADLKSGKGETPASAAASASAPAETAPATTEKTDAPADVPTEKA